MGCRRGSFRPRADYVGVATFRHPASARRSHFPTLLDHLSGLPRPDPDQPLSAMPAAASNCPLATATAPAGSAGWPHCCCRLHSQAYASRLSRGRHGERSAHTDAWMVSPMSDRTSWGLVQRPVAPMPQRKAQAQQRSLPHSGYASSLWSFVAILNSISYSRPRVLRILVFPAAQFMSPCRQR
jgi:hypothetical protein